MKYQRRKIHSKIPTRRKKHQRFIICFLLSLILMETTQFTKYDFKVDRKYKTNLSCNTDSKVYMMAFTVPNYRTQTSKFELNIKGASGIKEFRDITVSGDNYLSLYEIGVQGVDCYRFNEANSQSGLIPLVVIIMGRSDTSSNLCKVTHILTKKSLGTCNDGVVRVNLWDAVELGGSPGYKSSFNSIENKSGNDMKHKNYYRSAVYEFQDLDVANLDQGLVNMLVVQPLTKTNSDHTPMGTLSYKQIDMINQADFTSMGMNLATLNPSTLVTKMIQDDLPGLYFSDVEDIAAGTAQKVIRYEKDYNIPDIMGLHLALYISKPSQLGVNDEHKIKVVSGGLKSGSINDYGKIPDILSQISIKKTQMSSSQGVFQMITVAAQLEDTDVVQVGYIYDGSDDFIYISLTTGMAIQYYKSVGGGTAKAWVLNYIILNVHSLGKLRAWDTFTQSQEITLPEPFDVEATNVNDVYRLVRLTYSRTSTSIGNPAGIRVINIARPSGAYPAIMISKFSSESLNNRCMVDGFSTPKCLQNVFLKNKDEDEMLDVKWGENMHQVPPDHRIYGKCKIPYMDGSEIVCLIPKEPNGGDEYVTSITFPYEKYVVSNLAKKTDYEGLQDPEKDFYGLVSSNTGTQYLIECPRECSKCNGETLQCITCMSGANPTDGNCPDFDCGVHLASCTGKPGDKICRLCAYKTRKMVEEVSPGVVEFNALSHSCRNSDNTFKDYPFRFRCVKKVSSPRCSQYEGVSCVKCSDNNDVFIHVEQSGTLKTELGLVGDVDCVPSSSVQTHYFKDSSEIYVSCLADCKLCSNAVACKQCGSKAEPNKPYYYEEGPSNKCVDSCKSTDFKYSVQIDIGGGLMRSDCKKCSPTEYVDLTPTGPGCIRCDQEDQYISSSGSECKLCATTCKSCLNGSSCSQCKVNYYLDESTKACVHCNQPGEVIAGDKCKKCHSSCKTCSEPDLASKCNSCLKSTEFLQGGVAPSRCISCTLGQYYNSDQVDCEDCPQNCEECDNKTECKKCFSGFYLRPSSSECKDTCPSGFYGDSATRKCKACTVEGCKDCVDANSCKECNSGRYWMESPTVKCLVGCPEGWFGDQGSKTCKTCQEGCKKCSELSNCFECQQDGYYKDEKSKQCRKCGSGCKKCSGTDQSCVECQNPDHSVLIDGKNCSETCGEGSRTRPGSPNTCVEIKSTTNLYDFFIQQFYDAKNEATFSLELTLEEKSGTPFTTTKEIQKSLLQNKDKLKIETVDLPAQVTFKIEETSDESKFVVRVALQVLSEQKLKVNQLVKLKFSSALVDLDPTKTDPDSDHLLKEAMKTVEVKVYKTEKEELPESTKSVASSTKKANTVADTSTLGATLIMSLGAVDPEGILLKFNQFLTLFKRIQLIGIYFGERLESFIESVSGSSKEAAKSNQDKNLRQLEISLQQNQKNQIKENSKASHYKLDLYSQNIFFEGPFMIKSILLDISWLLNLIGIVLMRGMIKKGKIKSWKLKFLKHQRKVHFSIVMMSTMDAFFFGTRILLHRKNDFWGVIVKLICGLNITLLTMDLLTIIEISLNLKFVPEEDKATKGEIGSTEQLDLAVERNLGNGGFTKVRKGRSRFNPRKNLNKVWATSQQRRRQQSKKDVNLTHRKKSILQLSSESMKMDLSESREMINHEDQDEDLSLPNTKIQKSEFLEKNSIEGQIDFDREQNAPQGAFSNQNKEQQVSQTQKREHIDLRLKEKRYIDHKTTIKYNRRNLAVEGFSRALLINNPKAYSSSLILLNNLFNVIHLVLIQVSVASLPHSPLILISLLLSFELVFALFTIIPYIGTFKFISKIEFWGKMAKVICLEGFYSVCFFITISSTRVQLPVNKTLQSVGIWFIVLGIVMSYIFTVIKIVLLVVNAVQGWIRDRKKANGQRSIAQKEDLTQRKRGLIFYQEEEEKEEEFQEIVFSDYKHQQSDLTKKSSQSDSGLPLSQDRINQNRQHRELENEWIGDESSQNGAQKIQQKSLPVKKKKRRHNIYDKYQKRFKKSHKKQQLEPTPIHHKNHNPDTQKRWIQEENEPSEFDRVFNAMFNMITPGKKKKVKKALNTKERSQRRRHNNQPSIRKLPEAEIDK